MGNEDFDRIIDIYDHVVLALDAFEHRRLSEYAVSVAGTRVGLRRVGASLLAVELTVSDESDGRWEPVVRGLVDFADVLGWTLTADGASPAVRVLLVRLGFRVRGAVMMRLPAPVPPR